MKLVFDIGLHDGDDAAYYLHLGYRVIGVDANPLLVDQCKKRFAAEIAAGHMVVINAGILAQRGEFTFYRNLTQNLWSSFDPNMGKKQGKWEEIRVHCVTTKDLIEEHGKPHFIKVDIEGVDIQALQSLQPEDCPKYVSLELGGEEPVVEKLIELGYTNFKFVDGESYRPGTPIFDHHTGWRLLRKAGRLVPPVKRAIQGLPQNIRQKSEWNEDGKHNPHNYPFTDHSSGPFGEDAAGEWISPDEAMRRLAQLRDDYRKADLIKWLWWDVHGRR